jgi:hypothetical protein
MPGGETLPLKGLSAGIVKAARERVAEALAELDQMPMIDDEHIAVPWPVVKRPKLDPEVWSDSDIESVTITDLYASQHKLRKKSVADYIRTQGAPEPGHRALANVYAIESRNVIVDGHHRLAALWLLGADVANVWFLEE